MSIPQVSLVLLPFRHRLCLLGPRCASPYLARDPLLERQFPALNAYLALCGVDNRLFPVAPMQEPGFLNNVGNLLVRHHRFNNTAQKVAIDVLSRAIALDGTYADGYFNLGEALSAVSMHDKAIDSIRKAIKLDPQRPDYKLATLSSFSFLHPVFPLPHFPPPLFSILASACPFLTL